MAKNDITVEEFVKTKVLPEFQPIVGVLRKVLHKYAPDTREFMSYGIPNYKGKRGIAVISPAKTLSATTSGRCWNSTENKNSYVL